LVPRLIAASHSEEAAHLYRSCDVSPAQWNEIAEAGKEVLQHLPLVPGACIMMSALWVATARNRTGLPVHQVAGDLLVDGEVIYGRDADSESIAAVFDRSGIDWDGHSWIALGDRIGDASLFRTAYSQKAHPLLRRAIVERFGPGRGLLLATAESLATDGLVYRPRYVLSTRQMDSLLLGARHLIEG
jgi:hypothetical protein